MLQLEEISLEDIRIIQDGTPCHTIQETLTVLHESTVLLTKIDQYDLAIHALWTFIVVFSEVPDLSQQVNDHPDTEGRN